MARLVPGVLDLVCFPGGAPENEVFCENDGDEGPEPVADETSNFRDMCCEQCADMGMIGYSRLTGDLHEGVVELHSPNDGDRD